MMLATTVLSAIFLLSVIFLSFPTYGYLHHGMQTSISALSYELEGNAKALFMGWLVLMGIFSYFLDMGFWSHLMAVGFCISGMSPDHKSRPNSPEDEFHTAGTIVAIASGFAGLYFVYGVWETAAVMAAGSLVLWLYADNRIWWIEILAWACLAGGLYFGGI